MQKERRLSIDRRSNGPNTDRRSWQCQLDFPYLDGHGTLVTEDRRQIVERRVQFLEYMDGDRRKPLVMAFVQKN